MLFKKLVDWCCELKKMPKLKIFEYFRTLEIYYTYFADEETETQKQKLFRIGS